jgi:hypothetical protein
MFALLKGMGNTKLLVSVDERLVVLGHLVGVTQQIIDDDVADYRRSLSSPSDEVLLFARRLQDLESRMARIEERPRRRLGRQLNYVCSSCYSWRLATASDRLWRRMSAIRSGRHVFD